MSEYKGLPRDVPGFEQLAELALDMRWHIFQPLFPRWPEREVPIGHVTNGVHMPNSGIPAAWVAKIRESMARLTPRFSTNRAVREYTEQRYLPAASAYRERASIKGAAGKQVADWRRAIDRAWSDIRFEQVKVVTNGDNHAFEVTGQLAGLDPDAVRVELYADGLGGAAPVLARALAPDERLLARCQLREVSVFLSGSAHAEAPRVPS